MHADPSDVTDVPLVPFVVVAAVDDEEEEGAGSREMAWRVM